MLRLVALVRTASIIWATRIGELGTLAVTSNRFLRSVHRLIVAANAVPSSSILVTQMMEA
jgi:hypothetical protein